MDVDGMYENTPWERLALWAPWLGIGVVLVALLLFRLARRREIRDPEGGSAGQLIAMSLGTTGLSTATLGALFAAMWRSAHAAYPHAFGRGAIGVAAVALVVALLVGVWWRGWALPAIGYGTLTAAAAAATAIAAFSHTIIAEGQVTAMVLPLAYITCAAGAAALASFQYVRYRDALLFEAIDTLVFLGLAFVATRLLPVVQFQDDSTVYPVTGAFYVVALGRLARVWVLPGWVAVVVGAAAVALGYLLASWYGIAIAAVGLSISGALDPRRLPSAESLPPRLTLV